MSLTNENATPSNHPTRAESGDRNFDDLKDLFQESIYGSIKGTYRLKMTIQDLETELQRHPAQSSLTALDIGGGLGQVTLWLAQKQNFEQVVYYDISNEMKEHVDEEIRKRGEQHELRTKITTNVGGLREAIADRSQSGTPPDLVCLHAVLEWLTNPMEDLDYLLNSMQPNSILSLLYYNTIETSNTRRLRKRARKPSKLTPYHEFHHSEIEAKLNQCGFEITSRTGLRVKKFQRNGSEDELKVYLEEERRIARVEPYCRQGRYNHIVAVKRKV